MLVARLCSMEIRGRGKEAAHSPNGKADSDSMSSHTPRLSLSLSDVEDVHLDRLQQAELARSTPMSQWRAGTVGAWLEIVMAMPMYQRACAENVKSGKVLLSLSDEDLEGLGVSSSMHRRKLRLAIEDYREAENGHGLSRASELDHHWVCKAWLCDVGLPQYSQAFHTHLVDGRVLCSLTRRDLHTHLNVTRKTHQLSLLLAIELLHAVGFDKEVLQARRAQCEQQNQDPLVWSCPRVIKWVRDVDLKEYSDNLINSGIHGAVMVLDPSFSIDTMSTALGIPGNKTMVRRHLAEEMRTLLATARSGLHHDVERTPPSSRQSSLTRSHTSRYPDDDLSLRRRAVKPPHGYSPKSLGGRDLCYHGSLVSLPRDSQESPWQPRDAQEAPPRNKGSPAHSHSGIEITNV